MITEPDQAPADSPSETRASASGKVHVLPADGSSVMACCGLTPFEAGDEVEMTSSAAFVTCGPGLRELLTRTIGAAATSAALAIVQPRLDSLTAAHQALADLMERIPDAHMRFGVLMPDGTITQPDKCADWCTACKTEQLTQRATGAEATLKNVRILANQLIASIEEADHTYGRLLLQLLDGKTGA